MKIAVFCSANNQIDPDFFELTRVMGLRLGAAGHTLVYGGCNLGLMGCLARAWKDAGGRTVGVIPRSFTHDGKLCDFLDEVHYTQNLSDRKDLMLSLADAVVALPGGIGTLDEVFTVAAPATCGFHHKRVILYNVKGFWNSLLALLDDLQNHGMIRGDYHTQITAASTLGQLTEMLGA